AGREHDEPGYIRDLLVEPLQGTGEVVVQLAVGVADRNLRGIQDQQLALLLGELGEAGEDGADAELLRGRWFRGVGRDDPEERLARRINAAVQVEREGDALLVPLVEPSGPFVAGERLSGSGGEVRAIAPLVDPVGQAASGLGAG